MTTNFTDTERWDLLKLIEEKIEIIETRNTDHYSHVKKQAAWTDITEKFNEAATTKRKRSQLTDLYKRMKVKARKANAAEKRSTSKTGGGKPAPKLDDITAKILDLIKNDLEEFHNPYDDDSVTEKDK